VGQSPSDEKGCLLVCRGRNCPNPEAMAKDAVVQRMAAVCVAQFDQDPGKEQKLSELKEKSAYQRDDYVKEQGWATIPGEEKPDSKVADECAKLLMRIGQ